MLTLHRYHVLPYVPPPLEPLLRIARNLWWSWNDEARALFARIDPAAYEAGTHNPLTIIAKAPQSRLDELARDARFVADLERASAMLDAYLKRETWFERTFGGGGGGNGSGGSSGNGSENEREPRPLHRATIAYFSMEFGVHECLPVYSGGLGVLAGDHLKSASDLGIPLVGIGIAFSQGYFRQALDEEGMQHERYPPNDWHDLPVTQVTDERGAPIIVKVSLPEPTEHGKPPRLRDVALGAFRVDVGRIPLYLLDATAAENAPEDRALTNTLYGGDRAHRIKQEILLGVGGVRFLRALGIEPAVCHMNEGHSAFLAIERVRQLMEQHGAPFVVAREVGSAGNVFTTHTPVPAGNDAFPQDLIAPYLGVLSQGLGISAEDVMRIGRVDVDEHGGAAPSGSGGELSMPVLAIRMADRYNGVSVLHGREARAMWRVLWPKMSASEVPIEALTNGVHVGTWVSPEIAALFARHLGPSFRDHDADADPAFWSKVSDISDAELWETHERCRGRLVKQIRDRLRALSARRGRAPRPGQFDSILDPSALTIGFARRFATYKRGTLLLRDAKRLAAILSDARRPVQLVFSGKAHPQDFGGKELIRDIVRASTTDAFRGRIVFVEDYDMGVARGLVSGVDVWLNTPRRPYEASGTSGMKAAMNGVLHASVLDGWWCEAYAGDNGFAIGWGEEHADAEQGDRVEAQSLYRLLEEDIVPLFYDRDERGVPRGWVACMKRSIASVAPIFNTSRMVKEYTERYYAPAAERNARLKSNGLAEAWALCAFRERVAAAFSAVRVESVHERGPSRVVTGGKIEIEAIVSLGSLSPSDIAVDLYYGKLLQDRSLAHAESTAMRCVADIGGGRYRFEGELIAREAGEHAFAVRVLPSHASLPNRFATRLVAWQ